MDHRNGLIRARIDSKDRGELVVEEVRGRGAGDGNEEMGCACNLLMSIK